MEFFDLIEYRRSVRKFKPDIPPKEDLKKIINAARLAPSGHNKQMWHFNVIYNKELQSKLSDAVSKKYDELKTLPEAEEKQKQLTFSQQFSTFFSQAPVVIAVTMEPTFNTVTNIMRERKVDESIVFRMRPSPDLQSIGAAIQNICMAACDIGYGTCWMTAPMVAYKEMEEILNVEEPFMLVALIALGVSDDGKIGKVEKNRKELDKIMTIIE